MSVQTIQRKGYLAPETVVLNSKTMEEGTILNGCHYNPQDGWTAYEVSTNHRIEVWQTRDILIR